MGKKTNSEFDTDGEIWGLLKKVYFCIFVQYQSVYS